MVDSIEEGMSELLTLALTQLFAAAAEEAFPAALFVFKFETPALPPAVMLSASK